jgi:hypothetical protein
MPTIDDEGRLFGAINVIDALVVLLVLAVALAGITLVAGSNSVESETHYATLDLGSQPEYIVEQLDESEAQVFIEEEPHAAGDAASFLSRAAANASTARRSSPVRDGKSARISSSLIPPARYSRTKFQSQFRTKDRNSYLTASPVRPRRYGATLDRFAC